MHFPCANSPNRAQKREEFTCVVEGQMNRISKCPLFGASLWVVVLVLVVVLHVVAVCGRQRHVSLQPKYASQLPNIEDEVVIQSLHCSGCIATLSALREAIDTRRKPITSEDDAMDFLESFCETIKMDYGLATEFEGGGPEMCTDPKAEPNIKTVRAEYSRSGNTIMDGWINSRFSEICSSVVSRLTARHVVAGPTGRVDLPDEKTCRCPKGSNG